VFQQSIDLQKNDKTELGRLKGFITIDDDAWEERDIVGEQ